MIGDDGERLRNVGERRGDFCGEGGGKGGVMGVFVGGNGVVGRGVWGIWVGGFGCCRGGWV